MNNLKTARNNAGLTQKEVAKRLNITAATLSRYESGNIQPDPATLNALATIYNQTVDFLLGRFDFQLFSEPERDETEKKVSELLKALPPDMKKAALAQLEALAAVYKDKTND